MMYASEWRRFGGVADARGIETAEACVLRRGGWQRGAVGRGGGGVRAMDCG